MNKQTKTLVIAGVALLSVGGIIYIINKNKPTTAATAPSNNTQSAFDTQVLFISSATGVDKGLVKVGDKSFIDAWYNGLKLGNDTFKYNDTYFYTKSGQQFS